MANKEFVYLVGCKLKTRITENGIEKWCETCHFVDVTTKADGAVHTKLLIFKVALLITTACKRVTVQVRSRNTAFETILDSPVKSAREYSALRNAEGAIAAYIEKAVK